jgi:hypothetical protein
MHEVSDEIRQQLYGSFVSGPRTSAASALAGTGSGDGSSSVIAGNASSLSGLAPAVAAVHAPLPDVAGSSSTDAVGSADASAATVLQGMLLAVPGPDTRLASFTSAVSASLVNPSLAGTSAAAVKQEAPAISSLDVAGSENNVSAVVSASEVPDLGTYQNWKSSWGGS